MALPVELRLLMRLTAGTQYVLFLCPINSGLTSQNSIALAPPFPGLRRFKQGQNFSQWTGDDSKALMKVCRIYFKNSRGPVNVFQLVGLHERDPSICPPCNC